MKLGCYFLSFHLFAANACFRCWRTCKNDKSLPLIAVAILWFAIGFSARFGGKLGAQTPVPNRDILAAVNKVAPTVEEIAQKLWDLSEVSLLEVQFRKSSLAGMGSPPVMAAAIT